MSKSAIAFLTGLGTGYMNQSQKSKELERQAKLDAQNTAMFDANMANIKDQQDERQLVKDQRSATAAALSGGQTAPGYQVTDDAGSAAFTKDKDAAAMMADMSAVKNTGTDANMATRVSTGATGATQNGTVAGGRVFAGTEQASQAKAFAATQELSTEDKLKARMNVAERFGNTAEADRLTTMGRETIKFTQDQEKYAKTLKDEGAIEALKALRVGNGVGMAEAFNKGGQYKILGEPQISAEQRDIAGQVIPTFTATFQVQDKAGNIKPMTINSHDMSMSLMPYEKWYDAQLKTSKEGREGRESDSKIGLQGAQAGYYQAAAGAKDAVATKTPYERMSEIDKSTLTSINKQRETINTAMTKAQAEGSWDPAAPGSKILTTKLAALSLQEGQLAARYRETGDGAAPDPLNMRKPAPAAGTATNMARNTGKSGQLDILQQEFDKSQAALANTSLSPEERVRLESNITDLTKEFKNLGAVPGKSTAAAVPNMASGGAAQPRATKPNIAEVDSAPAAKPAPAAAPAADPVATREKAIAVALGAGSDSALDKVVGAKAPTIRAAADEIKAAQDALRVAAKKGDPAELQKHAKAMTDAKAKVDALLKGMNEPQAEKVRKAAGYYI